MLEPRWSKPEPGAVVPLPLIPAFADCAELHACDLTTLAHALGALDGVSRSLSAQKAPLPIEQALAGYLMADPTVRAELLAATDSPLRRYAPNGQRGLGDMAACSTFDTAVSALPISPVMRLDVDGLTALARRASRAPSLQLRTGDVRTARDARGVALQYPPAEAATARAASICAAYTACHGDQALLRSVWVLVALLNAHPFPDGNGRLARLLFAGALARAGLTHAPIVALGPLVHASEGAFEIALKRVVVQRRWQPLIDLLGIYADLLARHLPDVAASSGGGVRLVEDRSLTKSNYQRDTGDRYAKSDR